MMRIKILAFVFLFLIILQFIFFKLQPTKQQKQSPVVSLPAKELSQIEYKKLRDQFVEIVTKQDPRIALATLQKKAPTSEAITRSCHDLVHEIGHEAYEKYGDFATAMQYQDELCNSGYLHGIIESHFAKAQDIFATMQTVCSNYPATTFLGWECFHGVGHGLMYYTENDLPKSLSLCDRFDTNAKQEACNNGVFMENFNVDQKTHISHYVKADDPFYPCDKQEPKYKADCYLYVPTQFLSLHKSQYTQAITLCRTAEKDFRLICISGVGSQAIKEHIDSPKIVESLCMQGSKDETKACIQGMVGLYINHFGGLTEAKQLCSKLEKTNQSTCEQTIVQQAAFFFN